MGGRLTDAGRGVRRGAEGAGGAEGPGLQRGHPAGGHAGRWRSAVAGAAHGWADGGVPKIPGPEK